ncbi:MAG: alpha/beta hydrolase [Clostridiales bacterium]|nr:alpha/beta hydrolase [Clostridiales bacterium]
MKKRVLLEIILFLALCLLLVVGIRRRSFVPEISAELVSYNDPNILGIKITSIGQEVYDSVDYEVYGRAQYKEGTVEPIIESYKSQPMGDLHLEQIRTACSLSKEIYGEGTDSECEVYVLTPKEDLKEDFSIMYVHGGSYVMDLPEAEFRFCDELAQMTHARVYIPRYRPVFHGTYEEAYALLSDVYRDMCATSQVTAITGASAGGGLALGFVEYLNETGEKIPDKMVLFSPWVDTTFSNPSVSDYTQRDRLLGPYGLSLMGALWAGDLDPSDYHISPIYGDFSRSMPDTLIYIGTEEIMFPDAELLYEKMRSNGHSVRMVRGEGLFHVYMLADLPEAEKAKEIAVDFLCDQMRYWN